ncbi:MAG: DMT family transporter [Bacillota bacterium]
MKNTAAWMAFGAISFIWGSTFLAIKVGLEFMPPLTFASFRFFIAALLLVVFLKIRKKRVRLSKEQYLHCGMIGLLMTAIPFALVFWGQQYVASGFAAVLTSTVPFYVVFLAYFFLGEQISLNKILGVIVGFSGILLLFMDKMGQGSTLLGAFAVAGSAIGYGAGNVYAKRFAHDIHPDITNTVQTLVGAILLGFGSIFFERGMEIVIHWRGLLALLYLAIFGSAVAFGLFFWLVREASATTVSLVAFVIPVVSVILGLFAGEEITQAMVIGIISIFAGMAITEGILLKTVGQTGRKRPGVEK